MLGLNDDDLRALEREVRAVAVLMRISGAALSLAGLMFDPSNLKSLGPEEAMAVDKFAGPLREFLRVMGERFDKQENAEALKRVQDAIRMGQS